MPRSDLPIASDVMVREVVRQVADAAPPAPEFHELSGRTPTIGGPPATRSTWTVVAVAAAVTALVVSGIWLLRRPSSEPSIPAETVPAPPSWIDDPIAAWELFVATAEAVEVQLCLTRASSELAASGELPDPGVQPGLAGDLPGVDVLALQRPDVLVMDALAAHPALDATTASRLAEVTAAFTAADTEIFADAGVPSDDYETVVAAFEQVRSANLPSDPDRCPIERTVDDAGESSTGGAEAPVFDAADDLAIVRCLATVRLDLAIETIAADPTSGFESLVEAGASSLVQRYDDPSQALIDLVAAARDAVLFPADQAGKRLAALRPALRALADGACPLLSQPRPEPTPEESTP